MKTTYSGTLVASLFISASGMFSASSALAAPVSAGSETAVAEPAAATPGVASDPNIDRAFLQPTAMTQPAGTITYNNYELILHGFTYGVTDNVQATLTVLSPITSDIPFVGFGAVKWRFLETGPLHVALQGTVGYGHEFGNTNDSGNDNAYTLGAGGFATLCLRDDCSSLLSAAVNYQMLIDGNSDNRAHLVIYGGSLVHRVGKHVKLLGEVTSMAAAPTLGSGESNGFDNFPGVLVSYGLRFHTDNIAGDVGFIKPVMDGSDDDDLLVGLPFINLSYRWQ